MTGVCLYREEKSGHRAGTREKPCEGGSRDLADAATSQGTSDPVRKPPAAGREARMVLPQSHQEEPAPATHRSQAVAPGQRVHFCVKGSSLWHFVRTAQQTVPPLQSFQGMSQSSPPSSGTLQNPGGRLIILLVSLIVTLNGGSFGNVWRHLRLPPWEGLLASSGQSPGMLLTTMQAQSSSPQRIT